MKKVIVLMILTLLPAAVLAQNAPDIKGQPYLTKGSSSLFNPSRLKMSQSYSLGYFSGGGQSGSIGYYLNSLEYTFSNPLKVRIDLGFVHNPSSLFSRNASVSGSFVPGVSVDWRPTSALHFMFDYRQVPVYNGYNRYNGYYNPYLWEDHH
jgi:hypothetical protein